LTTAHRAVHSFPTRRSSDLTMGVKAISLNMGDELISMDVIEPGSGSTLLTVTNQGYGKRTELEEYPQQRRGGKGVKNIDARKGRSEEHTSELQSRENLVCRL